MGGNSRSMAAAAAFFLLSGLAAAWGAENQLPGFGGTVPLEKSELRELRGGEGTTLPVSELSQTAGVSDNTINNSTTGQNMISGEAFAGSGAFSVLIQNTGNHVVIQNSTIVNMTIER